MSTSRPSFDPILVTDLINKVKGKSSLAALCGETPIAFNGQKEFTFTMDSEIDIVAENGAKSEGGITMAPVTIVPIKFEYGARVSDEFLYANEEEQIAILSAFNEGFAKKVAKGLDIAAFHGVNPRTGAASTVIGTNHFDSKVDQTVAYDPTEPDKNVDDAIALVEGSDGDVTGMAASPTFRQKLADLKNGTNDRLYPELAWGGKPGTLNGLPVDFNKTVSLGLKDHAIVGDFAGSFKWGYAKEIPLKVIEYGNPDNSEDGDLQGHNQVYLRAEVYLGWGIMDEDAFARVILPAIGELLTVTSAAGTATGDTAITVSPAKASGNIYKYKVADTATSVAFDENVASWNDWDGDDDITAATGKKITIVEATAAGFARKAGSATVTAKA